jgi:hypothetical protein
MIDARRVYYRKEPRGEGLVEELVVWLVPSPVRGSSHSYKYRLAFIADNVCVIRYDNEAGKGDHKHIDGTELPYQFIDMPTLMLDFEWETLRWINDNRRD